MAKLERRDFVRLAAASAATAAAPRVLARPAGSPVAARITGPIPVNAQSGESYRGANEQPVAGPGLPPPVLIPFGYVEEEYFIEGEVDGKSYRTSMLVRKPSDPKTFSGLVAVETIHAAGAIPLWGNNKIWMGGGHGWVGIASQLSALETHVKKFNPARYASLSLPDAGEPRTLMGAMQGGAQDRISQAIMSQAGALLKSNARGGPFRRMKVKTLVMGGASQTGATTLRYIAESHVGARMAGGKPIYDGYLPMEAFADKPVPPSDAVIMHVVTEGDVMFFPRTGRPLSLRPDSDAPGDRYRHYQITGDSHVGTRGVKDPLQVFSTLGDAFHPGEVLSQFPAAELMAAAVHNFIEWLLRGVVPPKAAPISGAGAQVARDAHGNAEGGLRSAYVDVPTVRYIASAPLKQGDNFFRGLIGLQEPFPPEKLRQLYGDKAGYLARFNTSIDRMVSERWLLAADGARLKAEEARIESF